MLRYPDSDYRRTPTCSWAASFNQSRFLATANRDYEAGLINYAVGDPDARSGFLGYADDNWLDGTQSGVFSFVSPARRPVLRADHDA